MTREGCQMLWSMNRHKSDNFLRFGLPPCCHLASSRQMHLKHAEEWIGDVPASIWKEQNIWKDLFETIYKSNHTFWRNNNYVLWSIVDDRKLEEISNTFHDMDKRQTREAKSTAGHIIFISNLGKEHNINLKVSLPELYYCRKILLPVLNIFNHIYSKRTERLCVNKVQTWYWNK